MFVTLCFYWLFPNEGMLEARQSPQIVVEGAVSWHYHKKLFKFYSMGEIARTLFHNL